MGLLADPIQSSFTSGELDPRLRARMDVAHYYQGAEFLRNVLVLPQGGVARRPGLLFRSELFNVLTKKNLTGLVTAPNGGTVANLIDDDLATDLLTTTNIGVVDPYVIAQVDFTVATAVKAVDVRGLNTTGVVDSDNEVRVQHSPDDAVWTDFGTAFDKVNQTDIQRRRAVDTPISRRYWRVVRIGATDLLLQKFNIAELFIYDESATLSNVRLFPFAFSTTQNYLMVLTDFNLAIHKAGVVVADMFIPFSSAQLPEVSYVQALDTMELFHDSVQTHRIERAGADDEWNDLPQAFTNIIQFDFGAGAENVWSAARGWPRCGTFHKGRFIVGGSKQRPQTFWASKSGAFFDFDKGTALADEAFEGTLDTDDVSSIVNINSGRHLQIFTTSSEFYVLPDKEPLTPSNADANRTTNVGSLGPGLKAINVEAAVMFVQRKGRAVREFVFTDLDNPYEATNISLLSSHLIRTPVDFSIRKATSTTEGDLIFTTNNDGTLGVLQTLRSQEITAWTLWVTDGKFLGVNIDFDEIYAAVERTINSVTRRYLEQFDLDTFTDAAVQKTTGLPTAIITGLAHLNGEVCEVRADGAVLGDETPAAGQVTIDRAAATIAEVGLGWPDVKEDQVTYLKSAAGGGHTNAEARKQVFGKAAGIGAKDQVWVRDMPVELRQDGTSLIGKRKRVVEADLALFRATDVWVGANNEAASNVTFREFGADLLDEAPPLFTGDKELRGLRGYSTRGQLEVTQREPAPMTLLAISKRVTV